MDTSCNSSTNKNSMNQQLSAKEPNQYGDNLGKYQDADVDRLDSGIGSITLSMQERFYSNDYSLSLPGDASGAISSLEGRVDSGVGTSITEQDRDDGLVKEQHTDESVEKTLPEEDFDPFYLRVFKPNEDGDTFLHLAVIARNFDLAFDIISCCVDNPALLDIANLHRQTALHLAVLTNQPEIVRCLVIFGADVTCMDAKGNTPLHLACENGWPVQVDMLTIPLDDGERVCADLPLRQLPQDVNQRNYEGYTPLHLAARNNHVSVVRVLLETLRCDRDAPDTRSGRTALHHAVERRCTDTVKLLLRHRCNANALTYDDCSPLHLAVSRGLRAEAQQLLEAGASPWAITRGDQDVLELAAGNRRMQNLLRDAQQAARSRTRPSKHRTSSSTSRSLSVCSTGSSSSSFKD